MPLYEYRCRSGHEITKLCKYEARLTSIICHCGQHASIMVSMPAKTAWAWGDTNWDGYHDRGLNMTLRDKKHREQVMKSRGLREVNDGEVEAEVARATREQEKHDKNMATYQRVLSDTGSHGIAMAQTFPDPEV
jgi:hypothetical protein